MITKEYKISIDAKPKVVWFALWDMTHYKLWTSAFCEGAYAETNNWKEGTTVRFLAPNGNGMHSTVTRNKPYEKMFFTHNGKIVNHTIQPTDAGTMLWTGAKENYTLTEKKGQTLLSVTVDAYEPYIDFFETTFPKALTNIKNLSENFRLITNATIQKPLQIVWKKWTDPTDIIKWNAASNDWHTTKANNDLNVGGRFNYRMEAKNGSTGFDFEGTYTLVEQNKIEYTLADNRKVSGEFQANGNTTTIVQSFEPENENSYELQLYGWQCILDNFKRYVETPT